MIKDKSQLERYLKLKPEDRMKVDQMVQRHIAACAKHQIHTEIEPTFREAIDLVLTGWEPEAGTEERLGPRWSYEVYIPPVKEAA